VKSAATSNAITLPSGEQVKLVLASSSPRRVELLKYLGLPFTVSPSSWEETFDPSWRPERVVLELARIKAEDVARSLPPGSNYIVLGGDTIVVLDEKILGKPSSQADACHMLRRLSGRTHTVYTGIAVLHLSWERRHPAGSLEGAQLKQGFERSDVTFRKLDEQEIVAYVETGEPMDKAGAYALQGIGSAIVEKINGCYTNIIGFPLPLLVRLLRESGVAILGTP
jgi:septum formation protein